MALSRQKTIIMAFAMTLVLTGLVSVFLVGAQKGTVDLVMQDASLPNAPCNSFTNFSLSFDSVSGGTTVVFTDYYLGSIGSFGSYGLFMVAVGTVSVERRSEEKSDSLKTRIQDWISDNPGVHLRELQRCLGCAMGALQYHLYQLEADRQIVSIKNGNTKHFFDPDYSSDEQILRLTAFVRNPTIHSIISECSSRKTVTQAELSRLLDIDKSLVSYYVSHLLKAEVLNTIRVFGREKPLVMNEWAQESIIGLGLLA